MTEQELSAYIQAIRPADEAAMEAARRRQAQLAKPPGSLGALEDMSIRLSGISSPSMKPTKSSRTRLPRLAVWWPRAYPVRRRR